MKDMMVNTNDDDDDDDDNCLMTSSSTHLIIEDINHLMTLCVLFKTLLLIVIK